MKPENRYTEEVIQMKQIIIKAECSIGLTESDTEYIIDCLQQIGCSEIEFEEHLINEDGNVDYRGDTDGNS